MGVRLTLLFPVVELSETTKAACTRVCSADSRSYLVS